MADSIKRPISKATLEMAITHAVRKSGPDCETFVAVIIERAASRSKSQANWGIRGSRFGKSDRKKASAALATIVERMQRDFSLVEGCRTLPS
jgi:hypothetical protein